jgi:3-dehydroquinate synthase
VYNLEIACHKGKYSVKFLESINNDIFQQASHFIIDQNVAKLHFNWLPKNAVLIEAIEENKEYKNIESIIVSLLNQGMNRKSKLMAIGGGITQDITAFISSIFMRGISWNFIPTTLLSQADSCIGSKSSINLSDYKNTLGTFTAPDSIYICKEYLHTLQQKDIMSGVGEIVKLYYIDNRQVSLKEILSNLPFHIFQALLIKKKFVEEDEFDNGVRNILNYGHCFGHAIESASNYMVPHGIAVAWGMNIANVFALKFNLIDQIRFSYLQENLISLYSEYKDIEISMSKIIESLKVDKKATQTEFNLILPFNDQIIKKKFIKDISFWNTVKECFNESM